MIAAPTVEPVQVGEAELFTSEGCQAVRLPDEFRFDGDAVSIRKVDGGFLLEPLPKKGMTHEEVQAFFAQLDSYDADPLFPEGRDQGVAEECPEIL
jgi:virulence-associated protein VagC